MRSSIYTLLSASAVIIGCCSLASAEDDHNTTSQTISEVDLPSPLAEVRFATGSAHVERDALDEIAATVRWLREHPNRLLFIEGHADRSGDRAGNLRLSQRRADAVRDQLVRLGADPVRLVQAAHGEMRAGDDASSSRRVVLRGTVHGYYDLISAQRPARREDPRRERR